MHLLGLLCSAALLLATGGPLIIFGMFCLVFFKFYPVLPGFTGFYWVLLGFA